MYPWVKKYIGIPFASGGRDTAGLDCYGLVRLVLETEYDYELPFLHGGYTNALNIAETKKLFMQNVPILCGSEITEPEEKAVALLQVNGQLCHVGIYAGDGYILHARYRTGVVCERLSSPRVARSIKGWYRVDSGYSASQSV